MVLTSLTLTPCLVYGFSSLSVSLIYVSAYLCLCLYACLSIRVTESLSAYLPMSDAYLVGLGVSILRVVFLVGLGLCVLLRLALGLLVLLLVVHSLFFLWSLHRAR